MDQEREARQRQRDAERAARVAAAKDAAFNPSAVGRREAVTLLARVESPSEKKAREERERSEAMQRGASRIIPAAVREADGAVRLMSPEECTKLADQLIKARQALRSDSKPKTSPARGAKSDGRPAPTDARGIILPTGHASQAEVSDAELRFIIFRDELRSEIQAGKLDATTARKMLADAKREAHELCREVVRCRSRITGDPCSAEVGKGAKLCMRCAGAGWLVVSLPEDGGSFVDVEQQDEPTGHVRLQGADGLTFLDVAVTKGDPIEAAERYLLADANWVAATLSGPGGLPIHVATYWQEDGSVERDEKGAPLRTYHASAAEVILAATMWAASNPGAKVSSGLSRSEALRIHQEKERQTRRTYSAPLLAMAAKHGPERVPVDDPRLMSSRRDGCVVKVKPQAGMPISAELRKCMHPRNP